ncbi:MAG: hypothetical protein ACLFTR_01230 [Candidatus Woesearchaeota archaeon]
MPKDKKERELAKEVEQRLKKELGSVSDNLGNAVGDDTDFGSDLSSEEYDQFKQENLPKKYSLYEKFCKFSEGFMKPSPDKEIAPKLEESIKTCHLNVTPESATSAVYIGAIGVFFGVLGLGVLIFALMSVSPTSTGEEAANFLMFSMMMGLIIAMMAFFQLRNAPINMANQWRMKASNSMIICVFYIVTFMRHTSNLENGIRFASEHVAFPLSMDLKRIIWDVETERFESMTESLDDYLAGWKQYAPEFVESMNLIESSLLQGSEERRLGTLDKSLSNILEQTYEKMLHYAHGLQGPLSNLNMLGVILPVLGMVILPLVVSMMDVQWYFLFGLYNIILFLAVFNLGNKILTTRPNGYGDTSEGEGLGKDSTKTIDLGFTKIVLSPTTFGVTVAIFFLIIAFSPILINNLYSGGAQGFDQAFQDALLPGAERGGMGNIIEGLKPIDYRGTGTDRTGPFGFMATLASFGFTLAAGMGLATYYKLKSSDTIKIKEKTKKLEEEFAGSLFQLGNRLEDGLPTEIALGKVAESLEGSASGEFFQHASDNIKRLGMNVNDAIFNENNGAIKAYPSSLIASTMKVLVESAQKGPKIAAQAMVNVSSYIKEIHKVDERLRDLMSETMASMKSQIKMLTPLISSIVVGITALIIDILGTISAQADEMADGAANTGAAAMFGEGIPTYYFQIVVGIYVVQIVYLLTKIVNGIENGSDKLTEEYQMGINLTKATMMYTFVSFMAVMGFTLLAKMIMD